MSHNATKECLGIDISKDTLDIYWKEKSHKIKNAPSSINEFLEKEVEGKNLLCVMESTGGYERNVLQVFSDAQIPVHVAHPNRVHSFAKACNHFAKTDKLDAILLHKYGMFVISEEEGDVILDKDHKAVIALRRLARTIEANLQAARCRIKQMPELCNKYIDQEIKLYKKQLRQIQDEIDKKIDNHPDLKEKRDIMRSMKGIGSKISAILLAEVPEIGNLSKKAVASLVGVAPKTMQSGKKNFGGKIAGGRFYARKALYMYALVAKRFDERVKAKFEKMVGQGKAKKVAIVAIMRDAIVALNAMVKKSQPYSIHG